MLPQEQKQVLQPTMMKRIHILDAYHEVFIEELHSQNKSGAVFKETGMHDFVRFGLVEVHTSTNE